MSAFIVDKETIDKIISTISKNNYLRDLYSLGSYEQNTEFGKKLFKMNYEAVNQRYNENNQLEDYNYSYQNCSKVEAYKSAQCLRYQCSEGNVSEWTLYKELNNIINRLASEIISSLQEYEKANWG